MCDAWRMRSRTRTVRHGRVGTGIGSWDYGCRGGARGDVSRALQDAAERARGTGGSRRRGRDARGRGCWSSHGLNGSIDRARDARRRAGDGSRRGAARGRARRHVRYGLRRRSRRRCEGHGRYRVGRLLFKSHDFGRCHGSLRCSLGHGWRGGCGRGGRGTGLGRLAFGGPGLDGFDFVVGRALDDLDALQSGALGLGLRRRGARGRGRGRRRRGLPDDE